ncbi:hypothetical protein RintRC_2707 [Richelia intracellularis]|nr:hypothetical protein RintRC_2707 [Richelia intracellularis]
MIFIVEGIFTVNQKQKIINSTAIFRFVGVRYIHLGLRTTLTI